MRNIIRADLYRIFNGKGVYIAIISFIAYLILLVGSSGMGTIGVDVSSIQNPDDVTMVEVADGVEVAIRDFTPTKVTGRIAPKALADGVSDLIYFFLPFIVINVATDFSTGTAKNLLAGGLSRTKYFMSKMILIGIICVIIVLMYLIFSIGISTIMNGFHGSFDGEFLLEIAQAASDAIKDYDMDLAAEILSKLRDYSFGSEIDARLAAALKAIEDFDYKTALEMLQSCWEGS